GRAVEASERRPEDVNLPGGGGWEWRDDWHVDVSSKIIGREVDGDGWEYAMDFPEFNLVSKSRTYRDLDTVRRRCWIRTRAPKPLPLNSPHRPLYLVWQVDVTPQGRLQLRARSTVRFVNHTRLWLDAAALCSAWGDAAAHLEPLLPGQERDVPVLLAYASHYQFRPRRGDPDASTSSDGSNGAMGALLSSRGGGTGSGWSSGGAKAQLLSEDYAWCAPVPAVMNLVDKARDEWATCLTAAAAARAIAAGGSGEGLGFGSGGGGNSSSGGGEEPPEGSIHLVIHLERVGESCVAVHILPPLTVLNALPCSLRFAAGHSLGHSPVPGGGMGHAGAGASVRRRLGSRSGSGSSWGLGASTGAITIDGGDLRAADSGQLTRIFMGAGAALRIQLPYYDWSQAEQCLPLRAEEVRGGSWCGRAVSFRLHDGTGRYLEIQGRFEQAMTDGACPAMRLELFCPLWLCDRSGLSLDFAAGGKKIPRPVIPAFNPLVAGSGGGSGGGGEYEAEPRIADLKVKSTIKYEVSVEPVAKEGCKLYVDRDYSFGPGTLPPALQGRPFVRTANDDKLSDSRSFLKFRVTAAASVYVLYDSRAELPPFWLPSQGFRKTGQEVVVLSEGFAHRTVRCPFAVYARPYPANAVVKLGGNRGAGASTMYIVFVGRDTVPVPAAFGDAAHGAGHGNGGGGHSGGGGGGGGRTEMDTAWVRGDRGLLICNPGSKQLSVIVPDLPPSDAAGMGGGGGGALVVRPPSGGHGGGGSSVEAWSKELDVAAGQSGTFDIESPGGRVYELAIRSRPCPAVFSRSHKQVTIVPRFVLVNLLDDEPVLVKQQRTDDTDAIAVPPGGRRPWHWPSTNERSVKLRTPSTAWSFAKVPLDQVGSTAMHLPFYGADDELEAPSLASSMRDVATTAVGLANASGHSADGECVLLVLLWKAGGAFDPVYRISNLTPLNLRCYQARPAVSGADKAKRCYEKASYFVRPDGSSQLGWAYPDLPRVLAVEVAGGGGPSGGWRHRAAELQADGVSNTTMVETGVRDLPRIYGEVVVEGGTKVMRFTAEARVGLARGQQSYRGEDGGVEQSNLVYRGAAQLMREMEDPDVSIEIDLAGVGLSLVGRVGGGGGAVVHAAHDVQSAFCADGFALVLPSPFFLELLSFTPYIEAILASHTLVRLYCSGETFVFDGFNFADTSIPPTGIHALYFTRADPDAPALSFVSVRRRDRSTNTSHYEYVTLRLLEMDVQEDRAAAFRLAGVLAPVQGYLELSAQRQNARLWLDNETAEALARRRDPVPGGYCDIELIRRGAREIRRYFKTLVVHPIYLHLSWAPTPLAPGQYVPPGGAVLGRLPSINRSNVGLASYIVDDAFGALRDLTRNIVTFYVVLNLVGSVRALGSPADLVSNVGGGAKALFYEPLKGLVHSPSQFFAAVGKGAGTFGKATVHGVFNAMAGV
ncbi:unnamed protein product, partial [Phaeothamnion confervicola]